jgi:hypothetical protein
MTDIIKDVVNNDELKYIILLSCNDSYNILFKLICFIILFTIKKIEFVNIISYKLLIKKLKNIHFKYIIYNLTVIIKSNITNL